MSLFDIELPRGRQWLRLGDAYEVTRKPRGLDRASLPLIPFAPMETIPQGGAYAPDYTLRKPGEIKSGTYFERGDILVAKITPSFENGKQALAVELPTPFGYATTEVIPLRPRTERHDRRLLFFYLLHPDVRGFVAERMEGTTGRQRIPEDVLLDLRLPEFESEEQAAVADSLEMVQQLMEVESRSIQTATDLKRAAMQTLFTRGLRCEAQKETEIGPVPESWELRPIGEFARQLQYGLSVRGAESGRYPILRMNCQQDGRVLFRELQYVDVDCETATTYRLNPNDLLFNRTNSYELVGRTAIVEQKTDAVFASYLVRVSVDETRLCPQFLNYFLNWDSAQSELKKLASRGVSQANISAGKLRGFEVPVPSLDEQRGIVDVFDAIDRKIDLHRRKRAVLEELFKALLHKLMTGEIRVGELMDAQGGLQSFTDEASSIVGERR